MSLAIDNIKIRYSQEGYLPNYPPHLISDEEMCDAFINNSICYFDDNYPLINPGLIQEYRVLKASIRYHISRFLDIDSSDWSDLPAWVYSYMMGQVVGPNSTDADRHYFLVGIGYDNIDDEITSGSQVACYKMSKQWVDKLSSVYRTPIEFEYDEQVFTAELKNGTLVIDNVRTDIIAAINSGKIYLPESSGVAFEPGTAIVSGMETRVGVTYLRPPTMFGEPHVIKQIRLNESTEDSVALYS